MQVVLKQFVNEMASMKDTSQFPAPKIVNTYFYYFEKSHFLMSCGPSEFGRRFYYAATTRKGGVGFLWKEGARHCCVCVCVGGVALEGKEVCIIQCNILVFNFLHFQISLLAVDDILGILYNYCRLHRDPTSSIPTMQANCQKNIYIHRKIDLHEFSRKIWF